MDENNPIGAVCLEHGVVPEGHKGPPIVERDVSPDGGL
jgi:hypothetical protein